MQRVFGGEEVLSLVVQDLRVAVGTEDLLQLQVQERLIPAELAYLAVHALVEPADARRLVADVNYNR